MFSIEVASDKNQILSSVFYRKFKIIIGNYEEYFLCPLCFWDIEEYKNHWSRQLITFLSQDAEKTFLITEMYDPKAANFLKWWVIYRKGDEAIFQEQLVFMDELQNDFSLDNAVDIISDHKSLNDDGENISEWRLPLDCLKASPLIRNIV